jgi:hypothetical protein
LRSALAASLLTGAVVIAGCAFWIRPGAEPRLAAEVVGRRAKPATDRRCESTAGARDSTTGADESAASVGDSTGK